MTLSKKEEKEVKKNKEWAFIELGKLFPSHAEMHDFPDNITAMKCELLNKVYDILSQLDEPETLSSDWIDKNKKYNNVHDIGYYIPVENLQNVIVSNKKELDKAYKDGHDKGIELMEVMNMVYEDGEFWENEKMKKCIEWWKEEEYSNRKDLEE